MSNLAPKSLFTRRLFPLTISRFPSLLEDLENEMEHYGMDQSGLSLSEDNNHIFVEAKMPGLNAEDIDVTLENGMLRIQGERKEEEADKEKKYHRKASYTYSYRITLPTQADETAPEAKYKNGVMSITFPKRKENTGKKITVKKA